MAGYMREKLTIAQVDQIQSPRAWGVAQFLQPDLNRSVGMSSKSGKEKVRTPRNEPESEWLCLDLDGIPMKHYPLGRCCNAVVAFIQC